MTFVFDFDDFSPRNTNFGLLEELKEHFPNFKVTLFTVPWSVQFGTQTPITGDEFRPFCEAMRKNADWMEVALHGLTHAPEEFASASHDQAMKWITVGEKMLINRGIPFTKIFKAPQWLLSQRAKQAAEELGYFVAEDGYYNWNLKDDEPGRPFPKGKEDWILAHGHIQMVAGNGLEEAFHKIMRLPSDSKFAFLSEYWDTPKIYPEKLNLTEPDKRIQVIIDGKELK